jgi:hypothetical protein
VKMTVAQKNVLRNRAVSVRSSSLEIIKSANFGSSPSSISLRKGSDQSAPEATKPRGLLGVVHEETSMTVSGPLDAGTWDRIEALVRFASK